MNLNMLPTVPRFRRSLWVAIILLVLGCVFADVATFLTAWPRSALVALPSLPLILSGLMVFAISVFKDRKTWQRLVRQVHFLTLIVLSVVVGGLIWLNLTPRVDTVERFRRDDPIIKSTARGWPFPLYIKVDTTEFQPQPGPGPRESEFPLRQNKFTREGFVETSIFWFMNFLHWFLILLVILLVCEGSYGEPDLT